MSTGYIDWDAVNGVQTRAPKAPAFTQEQIDAAVADAEALPARKSNPDKVAVPWDLPDDLPTVGDIDFVAVTVNSLTLAGLYASNKALDRADLVWHIRHPGQAKNPSVFTTYPLVLDSPAGQVIVDGQHRLAALLMLGATAWDCYLLPTK